MSDIPIIQAEVVEVPKPERPECYAIVDFSSANGSFIGRPLWNLDHAKDVAKTFADSVLVRIPGSTPPPQPAAPEADAVEVIVSMGYEVEVYRDVDDPKYFWCHVRTRMERDVETERADSIQAAAAACLAKIRGAK